MHNEYWTNIAITQIYVNTNIQVQYMQVCIIQAYAARKTIQKSNQIKNNVFAEKYMYKKLTENKGINSKVFLQCKIFRICFNTIKKNKIW